VKLLTAHKFRSCREHNKKWLDTQSATQWFLDLLSGACERGTYVHVGLHTESVYDVLEISIISIGSCCVPRYYELGRLTRDESAILIREYKKYRRLAN
jgi:hypothetical protein